jgi:uncharacterized membrane protein
MAIDLNKIFERTPEGFHTMSWALYVSSAALSAATLGEFSGTLLFLGAIVVIVLASSRQNDAAGTIHQSHFANISTVMWVNLVAALLLIAFTWITFGIGVIITWPLYLVLLIWTGFKLIKGMMRLSEGVGYP